MVTFLIMLVIAFVVFRLGVFLIGDVLLSTPKYRGPVSDHFNGKHFYHPWALSSSENEVKGFRDVLKWQTDRKRLRGEWTAVDNPHGMKPPARVEGSALRATFIGHSSMLIQTAGLNIITDPVYSKRAAPFGLVGPKRYKNPGVAFDDLPKIDVILLSHNHYDHCDSDTLKKISQRDAPLVAAPLGVPLFLSKIGITNTAELDWWQSHQLQADVRLTAVPAQHFSARGTADRNTSLWCGFVVSTANGNVYFAGDSAYGAFFKEIGERFGTMRLAFIPIGAYRPEWFMSGVHTDPAGAAAIHRDVRSEKSIGIHWGTFRLTDEGMNEPPHDLAIALEAASIPRDEFIVLNEGEYLEV